MLPNHINEFVGSIICTVLFYAALFQLSETELPLFFLNTKKGVFSRDSGMTKCIGFLGHDLV